LKHTKKINKRVKGLDLLKLISAFLVVAIHYQADIPTKEYLITFCRVAVPVFFMINGFFWEYANNTSFKNGWIRIKKLAVLTAITIVVYNIYDIIIHFFNSYLVTDIAILAEWKYQFTPIRIVTFILFNDPGAAYQCWYMLALIYTYAIVMFFDKKGKADVLYRYAPFLLIIQYFLNVTAEYFVSQYNYSLLYRNWLFMAIPFFCIGASIGKVYQENKQRLCEKRRMFLTGSILILPIYVMEVLAVKYLLRTYFELYLSTIVLALLLFLTSLTNEIHSRPLELMSKCGAMYSTSIYCSHVFVGSIISLLINLLVPNLYKSYCIVRPVVVFLLSLLIAILYIKIKKYVSTKHISTAHRN
jgi:membrane protein